MPGNCPIKEDIKCTNRNKRIAKQTCCLIAVKQLHEIKELDDSCLPIRPEQHDEEDEDENDESTPSVSVETIDKQVFALDFTFIFLKYSTYFLDLSFSN